MSEHYPKAARRHLEDSKVLLDAQRWDGSAYLAGYVIECSLQALIVAPSASCPHGQSWPGDGHDLSSLAFRLGQMAASRRPGFKRNVSIQLLIAIKGALTGAPNWHPRMRYESSCSTTEVVAKRWWEIAKRAFGGLAKPFSTGGV